MKSFAKNNTVILAASLILVFCAFSNLYWGLLFYEADTFFLPCLYKNLVVEHGHWFFWNFPRAKFIFPDVPLYFGLKQFFPNDYLAPYFAQMSLHLLLLGFFARWFYIEIFKKSWREAFFLAALSIALFTSPVLNLSNVIQGVLWPTYHAGGMAMTMISIMLFFQTMRTRRRFWLLPFLAFAGGFSDPLYLLNFAIPVLVAVSVYEGSWMKKAWGCATFGAAVAGSAAAHALTPFSFNSLNFAQVAPLSLMASNLKWFVGEFVKIAFSKRLAFAVIALAVVAGAWRIGDLKPLGRRGLLFFVGALLPLVAGMLTATLAWRYFPLVILYSLFFVIAKASQWRWRIFFLVLLSLVAIFPSAGSWIFFLQGRGQAKAVEVAPWCKIDKDITLDRGLPDWGSLEYPAEVAALDRLKREHHLHDGLAQEWLCRPVNILSRENLRLHQIGFVGQMRFLLNSVQEYGVAGTSERPGNHDFVVTYMLNEYVLMMNYGRPREILDIEIAPGVKTLVLIYPPGVLDGILVRDNWLVGTMIYRLRRNAYLLDDGARKLLLP